MYNIIGLQKKDNEMHDEKIKGKKSDGDTKSGLFSEFDEELFEEKQRKNSGEKSVFRTNFVGVEVIWG